MYFSMYRTAGLFLATMVLGGLLACNCRITKSFRSKSECE